MDTSGLAFFRNMYKHGDMYAPEDTIAALATAPGAAGIAIIRISGTGAFGIADRVFRCAGPLPSARPAREVVYGHVHAAGHDLDEALLLPFRAPASYTREDVVEFHVHGGSICAQRLLATILQHGARLADPGEFTRRAFLAGRIDLLQAEAVMDLISAHSSRAASAALEQLEGGLSRSFQAIYEGLLTVSADLEAQLDFDEDELPARTTRELCERLEQQRLHLEQLAGTREEGHRLREGTLVVIAGRPNAGKSTLMNTFLQKDRAIVTPIPGTTRDSLEEYMLLKGYPLRLVDTAGIRTADCEIEQEGIRRSMALMQRADIVILILDASKPMDEEERTLIGSCRPEKTLILLNKVDIMQSILPQDVNEYISISCSLLTGNGLEQCKLQLENMLHISSAPDAHAVISQRHFEAIRAALNAVNAAAGLLSAAGPSCEMLAAIELRSAVEQIGEVTGRVYHDDLLATIFARFCVGK